MSYQEIKFKIWNKKKQIFINKGDECNLSNIVYLDNNGEIDTAGDDFIYLQYTGLKDNDEREIYEDDILEEFINSERKIGVCRNNIGSWGIFDISNDSLSLSPWRSNIIGNIWENANLLK